MMFSKVIRVEYEIHPLRAIYEEFYQDDGQNDEEVSQLFLAEKPNASIRKIERLPLFGDD